RACHVTGVQTCALPILVSVCRRKAARTIALAATCWWVAAWATAASVPSTTTHSNFTCSTAKETSGDRRTGPRRAGTAELLRAQKIGRASCRDRGEVTGA